MFSRARSAAAAAGLLITLVSVVACGGSPPAPSGSSVAGAWLANSTFVSATGGECVGTLLQNAAGSRDVFTTALQEHGTSLEATISSLGNGTLCAYTGTTSGSGLNLSLSTCQVSAVPGVTCAGGVVRNLQLIGDTLAATVNTAVGTGGGTDTSRWSVLAPGVVAPVGTLTVTANFTWIFLGVPSSDYHVFTGTIFPGYADGTISIPSDPNSFCSKCGWFSP
jgi:hypothetical protein